MTDVTDFEFHRFTKVSSAALSALKEELHRDLAKLQATDVSKLSGRDLRKFRDELLDLKWKLAVLEPEVHERYLEKLALAEADGRKLKAADLWACVLDPPTVRFL